MAVVSGFARTCSGLIVKLVATGLMHSCQSGNLVSPVKGFGGIKCEAFDGIRGLYSGIPRGRIECSSVKHSRCKHIPLVGKDYRHQLSYEDELPQEPFWLSLIKEAIWIWRSFFAFLIEQPSQLKHLEWPRFKSTLKTAILTLMIVAILIIVLSSVDAALCFLLSLFTRRTP